MTKIALASLRQAPSIPEGVEKIRSTLKECRRRKVDIVCFPETYLPGLRGASWDLPAPNQKLMKSTLEDLRSSCREFGLCAIVGMEWVSRRGLENRAFVFSGSGKVLGHQTKNQITPGGESKNYVPDGRRQIFRTKGVTFGISICHEGWRYPETVRWPAARGAKIVFQPQVTGSDEPSGRQTTKWGDCFYEKAMHCRAMENGIYFASVNQAMRRQGSATSLIDPKGELIDYIPRGKEDLLVARIDLKRADRLLAKRYRPEYYPS